MKINFKNWFKFKNIPDEIRILRYVKNSGGEAELEDIKTELNVNIIDINRLITVPVGGIKYLNSESREGKDYRKITVEGTFKLIEWENLQSSRRQFWVSITIAIVAMLISIGGIVWDSASDKVWQQEQIEILREISHTLNAAVIPAEAGI